MNLEAQALVYGEKSNGDNTQQCNAPVRRVRESEKIFPSSMCCILSGRKPIIQQHVVSGTGNWETLVRSRGGIIVLNAELKQTINKQDGICWLRFQKTPGDTE